MRRFDLSSPAVGWRYWLLLGLLVVNGCRNAGSWSLVRGASRQPRTQPISMADLHRSGGVPPGWRFSVAPISGADRVAEGHQVFIDFGCFSCHAVQGETFPPAHGEPGVGPDLTGMGSHHPAEYFVESILNPDAVLVDGPGYIGPDGHSIMPMYGDMSLAQLGNLVAYLQSLRAGPTQHAHWRTPASYYVQADEVTGGQFDAFEDWFADGGAPQLAGVNGLVTMETYVTRTPKGRLVVRVFGFEDDVVLSDFVKQMQSPNRPTALGALPPVGTASAFQSPAVYKAIGLAIP